jgi:glycosyltransferase involved in cell wall biosynthesis
MTKVLVVHNRYRSLFVSGENRVVEQEIDLLRRAGDTVVPYVRDSDEIAGFGPFERAWLPARVVWSPQDHRALQRLVARERPDVAHVHNSFPLISPSSIHALTTLRVPVVMTLHNFRLFCANGLLFREGRPCEECLGSSPLPGIVHGCYRGSRPATAPIALNIAAHRRLGTWSRVATFITLSSFARAKVIAGGLPAGRVVVKPNFVPAPARAREGPGSHFVFLGRLTPEKGADLLVSAWSATLGTLMVAGDGPSRPELEARAAVHGGTVRFLGVRSPSECGDLLRSARALVVPSRAYEGFPVAVVEAYAHGVPVIAPAHGAFPEVVQDGDTGLLYRSGDAADLRAQMRALSDPQCSVEMGAAARRAYEARYTPERNLQALHAIYDQAIATADPRDAPRSGRGPVFSGTTEAPS